MNGAARRGAYLILTIIGLVLYMWGFQGQQRLAALPKTFDRDSLAYPVAFEGIQAGSPEAVRFLAEGWSPGQEIHIVDADGTRHQVRLVRAHGLAYLLVTCFNALFFWAVCSFIFAPRVHRPAVTSFFWLSFLYGLSVMIGGIYFQRELTFPAVLLGPLQLICLALLPLVLVYVALTFPSRSAVLDHHRWLMPILLLLAVTVIVWQWAAFWRYFTNPDLKTSGDLALPQTVADGLLVVQVLAGFAIIYVRSRRLELTRERKQLRWLLWGFTLGAAPYVLLRTLPLLLGLTPLLPPYFDRILELAIPTSFVFAVVRYQFLDIDIVIRRCIIYAVLTASLLLLYLLSGVALGKRLEQQAAGWSWILLVAMGLLAGIGFNPLRRGIGHWVDRTFFKIQHNYGRALRELKQVVATASGQEQVMHILSRQVEETLQPRQWLVVIPDKDQFHAVGGFKEQARPWLEYLASRPPGLGEIIASTNSSSLPEIEREDFPVPFARHNVVLIVPFRRERELLGLLALGPRVNERRYVETDIAYLRGCAAIIAAALERIMLVQAVTEESLARQRLDELNRLKNDFLSQVAHDLRTPLASISWSTENLLDGIVGDLTPSQAEYLTSVSHSTAYLNRLVDNLLEISRIERGGLTIQREPVDVKTALELAMGTMKPVAASKQVRLDMQVPSGQPVVAGNTEKLVEVLVNLLDNAVKYSPAGGSVEIAVAPVNVGSWEISVRDHGPGLDGLNTANLCCRFEQGSPSPYSTQQGFGLGLYIVQSYLNLMGGTIEGTDHPEGGALFRCRLPEWASVPEDIS